MGKPSAFTSNEGVVEAPSIRKGEVFRATKHGLTRHQTGELRNGGKFNRTDELPYHRITSMSYEERVMSKGSKPLSILGIALVLAGLGIPALSTLISMIPLPGSKVSGLSNSLALPDLAGVSLGVYLLASKFPRKAKDGWWQIKGEDLTSDDLRGWQIAANQKGVDQLVDTIREGISRAKRPATTTANR